ncbi:MAG TPA: DUF507 family protein [Nitrospiria bacterium]|nr:DUF507 family protein [Nitrospiria bacterium]
MSEEKLIHLAHLVYEGIGRFDGVELIADEEAILKQIKQTLFDEFRLDDEIDQAVRARLASYSRKIVEGSEEWDVLYRKGIEEEFHRRRRG